MGKKEDLEKIDNLVRKQMIDCLNGDLEGLRELTPVIQYLAKNNAVSEKQVSTVEEDIQKRIEEAKKRREKQLNGAD